MELKLVDSETKNEIGIINLKFIPRKEEIIEFKDETYVCNHIIHSEQGVQVLVFKKEINYDISW